MNFKRGSSKNLLRKLHYIIKFLTSHFLKMQESCSEFERLVSAQCESLIQMIHERREFLLDTIRIDKESKIRTLKVRLNISEIVILVTIAVFAICFSHIQRF
jgi:hypothetical protein